MADQEMEGQDFTEDCSGGDFQGNGMENGEETSLETADGKKDSGAADAPGRDDDRYVKLPYLPVIMCLYLLIRVLLRPMCCIN